MACRSRIAQRSPSLDPFRDLRVDSHPSAVMLQAIILHQALLIHRVQRHGVVRHRRSTSERDIILLRGGVPMRDLVVPVRVCTTEDVVTQPVVSRQFIEVRILVQRRFHFPERLEHGVHVCVHHSAQVLADVAHRSVHDLALQLPELRRVEWAVFLDRVADGEGVTRINRHLFVLPPVACLDDHHAIGTARTIDGRGRGVLEDVYALNVVR